MEDFQSPDMIAPDQAQTVDHNSDDEDEKQRFTITMDKIKNTPQTKDKIELQLINSAATHARGGQGQNLVAADSVAKLKKEMQDSASILIMNSAEDAGSLAEASLDEDGKPKIDDEQALLLSMKKQVQLFQLRKDNDKLKFDPPSILALDNIRNIEAISRLEKRLSAKAGGKKDMAIPRRLFKGIEDDMKHFSEKEFH